MYFPSIIPNPKSCALYVLVQELFEFSLEQMRQDLKDLERCVAEWSETSLVTVAREEEQVDGLG